MKPLIILLGTFVAAALVLQIITDTYAFDLSARIAMSVMLLFTGLGHFKFTRGMAMMVPRVIPFKKAVVWLTGLFEILAAIALQIPAWRATAAWALIIFFILIFPANIKAALQRINYETGTYDGKGSNYLWFRGALQLVFIVWLYVSSIHY